MKSSPRSGLAHFAAKITELLARIIAHRTKTLIVVALAIAALSIFIVIKRQNFDSEVLDLLPSKFRVRCRAKGIQRSVRPGPPIGVRIFGRARTWG